MNRITQNSEVTVWTYESPNSIEAYVMKTRKKKKKKKKKKVKLAWHHNSVSKYLRNQMANLTEDAFRHTLTTWANCELRGPLVRRMQQRNYC